MSPFARCATQSFALAMLALASCGADRSGGAAEQMPIRVVLITLDTLRYDSFMGTDATPSQMPRVHARAKRGAYFTRFYSASSTTQPAHASMFTGLQPWEHGVTRNGQILDEQILTVAEILRREGFRTRAVVASFPVSSRFGFGQGFDSFSEDFGSGFFGREKWEKEWEIPGGAFFSMAEPVTERAIAELDAASGSRQFFWFHYFDPHSPYGGSRGGDLNRVKILRLIHGEGRDRDEMLRRARELYQVDLAYLDAHLDRLLERLERDQTAFETHVLVVSDHGESFGEDGALGHGWRLNEAEILVPAFLLSPRLEPGARSDIAGSVDVAATLLSVANVSRAAWPAGSRDLSAENRGSTSAHGMRRTFRDDPPVERTLEGERREIESLLFYTVAEDGRIRTGNSRRAEAGENGKSLATLFGSFEARLAESAAEQAVDPAVRQALEALGYVD